MTEKRIEIGILGAGQLAKMTGLAASELGCRVAVLDRPDDSPPLMSWRIERGDWNAGSDVTAFGRSVDCLTLENEFVDADALEQAEAAGIRVYPSSSTMRRVQDKWIQKTVLRDAGLPVPEFCALDSMDDLDTAIRDLGFPLVLKRRRDGYDGKGNATVRSPQEARAALDQLGGLGRVMAEQFCCFDRELAVMSVRSIHGEERIYPVVETVQKDHICHWVYAPASMSPEAALAVQETARRAVAAFDGVGCFGVEMFQLPDGTILINEMAPRVHNSGHYTIEACVCSQFENHVRAVLGWPLGSTAMQAPFAVMVNLLGEAEGGPWPAGYTEALAVEGVHLHVYGKAESRKGRKMAHLTVLGPDRDRTERRALQAAACIHFGGSSLHE